MGSEEIKACNNSITHLQQFSREFETTKDGDKFMIAAQECLEQGNEEVLLNILNASENHELLIFVGWDLAKMVFRFLPDDCSNNDTHLNELLYFICEICNPREICLTLSELLIYDLSWQKLVMLLQLFILTCRRLDGKIGKILISILKQLERFLKQRNDLLEHDAILKTTLEFAQVLTEKTQKMVESKSDDVKLLKEGLKSFLIALLEHPFVFLEFKIVSESQETEEAISIRVERNRQLAEALIRLLSVLEDGCLKHLIAYNGVKKRKKTEQILKVDIDETDKLENDVSIIGLACLSFLIHVEGIGREFIPVVTTGKYSLLTNMVYVKILLCHDKTEVISKGISLLLNVLSMVEVKTIDHNHVDNKDLIKLLRCLKNLMIHSNDSGIRQDSVKGFKIILGIFTSRGKYRLLRSLWQEDIQSGFAELLSLILKDDIVSALQNESDDTWFLGRNLESFLLDNIFKIPSKAWLSEFGIIEESSRVLAALNLLRFLLIRDKENKTRIHTMFPQLEKTFLKQLRDILQFSKTRITMLVTEKQNEIKTKSVSKDRHADEAVLDVITVGGKKLDQGSPKEQLEVLESAYLTLDMIESILARIGEVNSPTDGGISNA